MAGTLDQIRSFVNEKMDKMASSPLFTSSFRSPGTGPPSRGPGLSKREGGDPGLEPEPCVGFRVTFNPSNCKLTVNVIAARHLPAHVSKIPAVSYLVKVKLYPGKEKFETDPKPESWPTFNQHFNFNIPDPRKTQDKSTFSAFSVTQIESVLTSSKFLTFTVFAVDKFQRRKAVGSATWPLDHKLFLPKRYAAQNHVVETAEIWKKVVDLSSGLSTLSNSQQRKIVPRAKDQLEISLCHSIGEVGEDDVLTMRVDRLRWSIDKTKEYQHKNADLYVKLGVSNCFGQVMRCQKTMLFSPSISVHWPKDDPKGMLQVSVPPLGPRNKGYHCTATLCAKVGKAGKKVHLGRAVIHQTPEKPEVESDHWTLAAQAPGKPITQWHNLLDTPA